MVCGRHCHCPSLMPWALTALLASHCQQRHLFPRAFFGKGHQVGLCWGQASASKELCLWNSPDLCLMGPGHHPLGRTFLRLVLHNLPEVSPGISLQLLPVVTCSLKHPEVASFPSLPHIFPPPLVFPAVPKQMNDMLAHLCLKVILRGSPAQVKAHR